MSNVSWDLDKGNQGGSSKAEFVKFPEGITRIRVIDHAPYQRWIHFMRKHKRSFNCPGKGCPICEIRKQEKAQGLKVFSHDMQKRFAFNVINRETKRVEILEQGKTFAQDLKDLMTDLKEKNLTLADADIKVRRRGTSKDDTSYRLDIDEKYPLSAEDEALLKNKVDFEEYFKPHTPEQILRILNGEAWEDVMKSSDTTEDTPTSSEPVNDIGEDEDIEIS